MKTLHEQAHRLASLTRIREAKTYEGKREGIAIARYIGEHLKAEKRTWDKIEEKTKTP